MASTLRGPLAGSGGGHGLSAGGIKQFPNQITIREETKTMDGAVRTKTNQQILGAGIQIHLWITLILEQSHAVKKRFSKQGSL